MTESYTSLEARLHDAFWDAEKDVPELEWLDALLTEHPGNSLEVGCGSGRLLLPLLAKGHAVEGIDSSAEMLELCRRAAADAGLDPVLHHGDMATFPPDGPDGPRRPYANLLVPAFTLQLAGDPVAAVANFHRLLQPGGRLYLTVFVPWAELNGELPENEWYEDQSIDLPDGRHARLETRHRLDRKKRVLEREHHYRLVDGDAVEEHHSRQLIHWFTPRTLRNLLKRAGFEVAAAVAEFDQETPVTDEAQIITLVAVRSEREGASVAG